MLKVEIDDFEKKYENLKEGISKIRKKLNRANVDTSDRSQKYTKIYHEMILNAVKQKRHDKDLYNTELSFRVAAQQLIKLQKAYGKELMK
jgi:hypothetical protein